MDWKRCNNDYAVCRKCVVRFQFILRFRQTANDVSLFSINSLSASVNIEHTMNLD